MTEESLKLGQFLTNHVTNTFGHERALFRPLYVVFLSAANQQILEICF